MKRKKIDIPVIVITAVAGALQIRSDPEARYRIDGFVSKPYLHRDLIGEIERVLKKRKYKKE
jgi:response regulator RpfG family c-di-GMP phosphodiesterase